MSKLRKRLRIAGIALLVIVLLETWGYWLKDEYYTVGTKKNIDPIRIVFISDLHNGTYGGKDQSLIWKHIQAAEPDIVLFGGDTIDMFGDFNGALTLMKRVKDNYPCAYAVGNHERIRKDRQDFYDKVAELGIPQLDGTYTEISIKDTKVCVYGIWDAFEYGVNGSQLENCCDALDSSCYNILLDHQPEEINRILEHKGENDTGFDLVLSGHAHGGQWRLPVILEQGLYAPDQGIFPDYTNGIYEYGGTTHIISRGLARPLRMIFIPRIFNRPELSVIDIQPQ